MNEIFLGRTEEQRSFKKVLNDLIEATSTPQDFPRICLIHGSGGMGKTSLLQRLHDMSQEEPFQNHFNTLSLNWEKERENYIGLQVEHDHIQTATVLEVIYQAFKKKGRVEYFQGYRQTQTILKSARKKIKQAEEEQEKSDQPVQPDLTAQELDVYKNPEARLVQGLRDGIAQLAEEKPLLIFFDTYELVDRTECDELLRDVMKNCGGKVVWVIAGRSNLADNVWRNEAAQKALSAALEDEDPDVVAVAIRSLGRLKALEVPQLIRFLNLNESKDRYVREAAARELGYMADDTKADLQKLLEAVEPLISAMRNDYMKPVREAASKAGRNIYFAMKSSEFQLTEIGKKLQRALVLAEILESEEEEDSGATAPEKLLEDLNNPDADPDLRATAAAALGEIGTPTAIDDHAIEALIKSLEYNEQKKENDSFVRLQAAEALGKLTATAAIDALNKAIRQDKFSNVRAAAKNALLEIKNQAASDEDKNKASYYLELIESEPTKVDDSRPVSDLLDILNNSSHNLDERDERRKAALALGSKKGNREVIETLINALKETQHPDICAAIANSLGQLEDPKSLSPLLDKLEELTDGDWIARRAVIKGLGELKTSGDQLEQAQVVKILENEWRNDAISNVRDAIQKAIEDIYVNTGGSYAPAEQALRKYSNNSDEVISALKARISSANKN